MNNFDLWDGQYYASGSFHKAEGTFRRTSINPSLLEEVGTIAAPSAEQLEQVLDDANRAHRAWRWVDSKTRARLLHQVADSIERTSPQTVAEIMTREMGKPYPEAVGEMANVASAFRYMAEMARDEAGRIAGTTQTGSFQYYRYEPYGVSAHIMPYNFPLLILGWTVAASLAAGNAVILKPAEATTLCTLKFMEHFNVLPEGLVNCVAGGAEIGQQLVSSEKTHIVAFTGSVDVGKAVNQLASHVLKPCLIEAGGNDPMVISDAIDIDFAASAATTGCFHLSGQICTSTERLFVHKDIHDAFVTALVERAKQLRVGDGMQKSEIGPLVSEAARDKVARAVEEAVAQGATVEYGGKIPANLKTGWFYEPTVLSGVEPRMNIMQRELFGPVAPICKFDSFEHGIQLANDSQFGLGCSVLSTRLGEIDYAIEIIETGMVWINNPLIDNDALPFGGRKLSGFGNELGREGLNAFRQTKMVIQDSVPQIHDWWYPYDDSDFHPDAT